MNYYHYSEKNIAEIKKELTTFLIDIMTPFMYEGIKTMYDHAIEEDREKRKLSKDYSGIASEGVTYLFLSNLKETPDLSYSQMEKELKRIKEGSKCYEWFDDLIRSVIKSYIVLLTYSTSKNTSELVNKKLHDKIDIPNFIHSCYNECAREVYIYPELFDSSLKPLEIKQKQREFRKILQKSIDKAIMKTLPMKEILIEFLHNDYIKESECKCFNNSDNSDNDEIDKIDKMQKISDKLLNIDKSTHKSAQKSAHESAQKSAHESAHESAKKSAHESAKKSNHIYDQKYDHKSDNGDKYEEIIIDNNNDNNDNNDNKNNDKGDNNNQYFSRFMR
jgi:hypothetical protein